METSTKIAAGAGIGALACLGLALYFRKRKETTQETICDIACGCASTVALGAIVSSLREQKESQLKIKNISQPIIAKKDYRLSEIYSKTQYSSRQVNNKATQQHDENTVRRWLYDAINFIKNNASEEEDFLLADKLCRMMNGGKIQLDDTHSRHETFDLANSAKERIAFFDPYRNTVTGKQRNIIVLDTKMVLKKGYADLIDSISHEGWHAVQEEHGLITVDKDNQMHFNYGFNLLKIELGAYNMGRKMHDRYAAQNGMILLGPLTEDEIRIIIGEHGE